MKHTSFEEQVTYGLNSIKKDKTVEVNLRDLIQVYKLIEELNRFFHQPLHYQKIEDIQKFLGDKNTGAYKLINKTYYETMWEMIPENIKNLILGDNNPFENPNKPNYLKEK